MVRPIRIDPDTRDSITFIIGIVGVVSQGVLWAFHVEPSAVLLGVYASLLGLGLGGSVLKGSGRNERDRDKHHREDTDE